MSHPAMVTLPDLPLLNILKRLPLYDLVYGIRQTCARFRVLAPTELARRRTLVLTHGDDQDKSLNSLREDKLHCGQLLQLVQREDGSPVVQLPTLERYKFDFVPLETAVHGAALMSALPGITHLTVSYSSISPVFMNRVIRMLIHWSDSLVSLTIYLKDYHSRFGYVIVLPVFEAINRLNSLRHLKIGLPYFVPMTGVHPTPNLHFVSQLSTLCVKDGIEPELFFESLAQFGTANVNLRKVCYHVGVCADTFPQMLQFGLDHPRLATCFTALSVYVFCDTWWNEQSVQRMDRLCTRFASLTTLELDMEPTAMAGLAQQLRRLQHLVTLKLNIERHDNDDGEPGYAHGWPILDEYLPPPDDALLVGSVRVLQLALKTASHRNLAAIRIAHYFPNIQVLHVTQFSGYCYDCTPDAHGTLDFTIYHCLLRSLQPFRVCAHLRTIVYNPGLTRELSCITPQQLPLYLD